MVTEKIGRVVGGSIDHIVIRENPDVNVALGEIVYCEIGDSLLLYQIYHIEHASLLESKDIHSSAYRLEKYSDVKIYEKEERYYNLLYAKPLTSISLSTGRWSFIKFIPPIFYEVKRINEEIGEKIVQMIGQGVEIGKLRSGNNILEVNLPFDFSSALNHHILIAATTGRGKSNLLKVLLWKMMYQEEIGFLVMDPHAEYITPSVYSLGSHPNAGDKLIWYTTSNKEFFQNTRHLLVSIKLLKPYHFLSVFEFSEAQVHAMYMAYQLYKEDWIKEVLLQDGLPEDLKKKGVKEDTFNVLKRKLMFHLNISVDNDELSFYSIFRDGEGLMFSHTLREDLENGKIVVIDTSELTTSEELLVMSLLSAEIFEAYKKYKKENILDEKSKIGIILEEAPRLLGSNALKNESNIFGAIAREGRKFNIGLIAVTQLPSLIPNEIISNMNTKVILGIEMQRERNIVINSSPHDLTKDEQIISSLNKGEAIISSIFTPFPLPVYIYPFDEIVNKEKNKEIKTRFSALKPQDDIEI